MQVKPSVQGIAGMAVFALILGCIIAVSGASWPAVLVTWIACLIVAGLIVTL